MKPETASNPADEGTVYTETVVFSPPEQYAADAPYQLAIIDLTSGERRTVRILAKTAGERVNIGDPVVLVRVEGGVAYYRKNSPQADEEAASEPRPLV